MENRVHNGPNQGHLFQVTERSKVTIKGVAQVGAFDEEEIYMMTVQGALVVKGEGLHVTQLNLEQGQVSIEGKINGINYVENSSENFKKKGKNLLSRLLK